MTDDGVGNLHRGPAGDTQPVGQVHVLRIAEVGLVEAAELKEDVPAVEGGRSAGAEHLALRRHVGNRPAQPRPPGQAGGMIDVADPVEFARVVEADLGGTEAGRAGPARARRQQLLQPLRIGPGVWVEGRQPRGHAGPRRHIVGDGEAGITAQLHDAESSIGQPYRLDGPVGGIVVDDHRLEVAIGLGRQGVQARLQEVARLVGHDGHGDLGGVRLPHRPRF